MINKPIPTYEDAEVVTNLDISHSPFILVEDDEDFIIEMQYPLLPLNNAIKKCYMRKEVYEKLKEAALLLPDGYKFKILDAYRPFALQEELYYFYKEEIIEEFDLKNKSKEEQDQIIKKFVSLPLHDSLIPPVHTTGGAIDLTIVDDKGNELEMGTKFDEFTSRTHTSYYEDKENSVIKSNRRLLYNIMTSAHF